MNSHVSSATPHPVFRFAMPATVYITVSRSGEICSPRCSKSSPVLTMIFSRSGGRIWFNPHANFAPPTPPVRATIIGIDPFLSNESERNYFLHPEHRETPEVAPPAALHRPAPSEARRLRPPRRQRRPRLSA